MKLRTDWWQRQARTVVQRLTLRRRDHYVAVFGRDGERTFSQLEVLADMAKFCRAQRSCWHEDARAHALAEGRREVWLRIQQTLRLTDDQVAQLMEIEHDDGSE